MRYVLDEASDAALAAIVPWLYVPVMFWGACWITGRVILSNLPERSE